MRSMSVSRISSVYHSHRNFGVSRQCFIDRIHIKLIIVLHLKQIFGVRLEIIDQNRVNFSRCQPLQLVVEVTLSHFGIENLRSRSIKFLIVNSNISFQICVSVNVEEKSCCRIFRNSHIGMARWSWRTSLLEFQPASPVCVDGWSKEITCVSYFIIIKCNTRLVKEKIPENAQQSSDD